MYILRNGLTNDTKQFLNIYQISKYFYENGVTKNKNSQCNVKYALKHQTAIYKHYFILKETKE